MNHGTDVELFFIFRGGEVEVWMFKGIGVKYSFQHFYLDPDGDLYVVEIRQYGAHTEDLGLRMTPTHLPRISGLSTSIMSHICTSLSPD